jgi:hypothetical protein
MTFNALISNIDNHPRNHALIAEDRDWRLSPAYDLTPSPVVVQDRRDLAMEIGDLGRFANAKNILSQHTRFLLEQDEAKAIVLHDLVRRRSRAGRHGERTLKPSGAHLSMRGFRIERPTCSMDRSLHLYL